MSSLLEVYADRYWRKVEPSQKDINTVGDVLTDLYIQSSLDLSLEAVNNACEAILTRRCFWKIAFLPDNCKGIKISDKSVFKRPTFQEQNGAKFYTLSQLDEYFQKIAGKNNLQYIPMKGDTTPEYVRVARALGFQDNI